MFGSDLNMILPQCACRLSDIINHLNTEQNFTFFHIVWHIGAELVSSAGVENTTPFKVDIEK